ncbi:MAG: HEAT repeat domain-containing protein [Xenococcaceae cyanobacterium MO_207.B15]|nr:HEAT repeat domain-containing protein [Xenococcaceae cyanobacterium MO_207.B15]
MTNILDSSSLSAEATDILLAQTRSKIALKTFDSSDRQTLQQMVECLGDSRGIVRLGFAEALGDVGQPAIPFLVEALSHHSNEVVRRAAAKTLTLIGDPVTIPPLLDAFLNDEDQVVRNSSVGALARIGEQSVTPLLEILASNENDETIKGHAAWALAFIGSKGKEQIYKAYHSDSEEVRTAVVGAIAKIAEEQPEARAFKVLLESLSDSSVNVRSEAAAALGNLAHVPAIPHLLDLLTRQEVENRKSAALALMKIGDRTVLEPLQNALTQESDSGVKQVIQLAITQLNKQLVDDEWE